MPLALEVTRSMGGSPTASGFAFFSAAIVALVASMSFFDVGARFVPPVEVGS